MSINEIIRKLRESREIKQNEMALALNVDVGTIVRWEQPGESIKTKYLDAIAKFLGVTVKNLYEYQEQPTILSEPLQTYKKMESNKVSVMVQLDGSVDTLNNCFALLKKLNAAL